LIHQAGTLLFTSLVLVRKIQRCSAVYQNQSSRLSQKGTWSSF